MESLPLEGELSWIRDDFVRGVRARVAWERGELEICLEILAECSRAVSSSYKYFPSTTKNHERFLRGRGPGGRRAIR